MFSFIEKMMSRFRGNREQKILAEVLTDSRSVFSSFGRDIYMSDLVNNCIDRIAVEISKIEVASVIEKKGALHGKTTTSQGYSASSRTSCNRQKIFCHVANGYGENT